MIWVKIAMSLAAALMAVCFIGMATLEHDRTQAVLKAVGAAIGIALVASCIGAIWSVLP